MIQIESPDTRTEERIYIYNVIFTEILGISWTSKQTERRDTRLTVENYAYEILLPDILFSTPEAYWLKPSSLPNENLNKWDTRSFQKGITLTNEFVPILYGQYESQNKKQKNSASIPIDIFGSAFFMLSRYEEIASASLDKHMRFPAQSSLAYKAGFLDRPIVDEYIEILWSAIRRICPNLKRKKQKFKLQLSHDVDCPSHYAFSPTSCFIRFAVGDLLKRKKYASAIKSPFIRLNSRKQIHNSDPANTFDWIMKKSESKGLSSSFFFICGRTHPNKDADYEIEHPALRKLLHEIHTRGHEIGLHPSYNSYLTTDAIAQEAHRLKGVCKEEGVNQTIWGGRMHYLRWSSPQTALEWEKAGMDYDSTLGYADQPGFRCGTCREFQMFDPVNRRTINLKQRPLIVMDCTITAERYLNLGTTDQALNKINKFKSICKKFNGDFNLLWHNNQLITDEDKELYCSAVG